MIKGLLARACRLILFYAGADLSTNFYRIYNIKADSLGIHLNGLRHIITPTVGIHITILLQLVQQN